MSRRQAAVAAHRLLGERLQELTRDDRTVPCHGSLLPISDDGIEREFVALAWCPSCPALDACRAAGAHEPQGVWGAVDRTPRPSAASTPTSKETPR